MATGPVMHRISVSLPAGRQGIDATPKPLERWNLHAREMAWSDFDERRRCGGTVGPRSIGNTLERVGAVGAQGGYGTEQTTGVGVRGSVEDVAHGSRLDYGAGVHDGNAMRDL